MAYISPALRKRIVKAAKNWCGYCQTQEVIIGMPLEVEHIIPEALNGGSEEENLWLACPRCNRYKGTQIQAEDQQTGKRVPLFNPRTQNWNRHFIWDQDGLYLRGLTATGRATVNALQMNNPFIVQSRQIWITWGWHPPHD